MEPVHTTASGWLTRAICSSALQPTRRTPVWLVPHLGLAMVNPDRSVHIDFFLHHCVHPNPCRRGCHVHIVVERHQKLSWVHPPVDGLPKRRAARLRTKTSWNRPVRPWRILCTIPSSSSHGYSEGGTIERPDEWECGPSTLDFQQPS